MIKIIITSILLIITAYILHINFSLFCCKLQQKGRCKFFPIDGK